MPLPSLPRFLDFGVELEGKSRCFTPPPTLSETVLGRRESVTPLSRTFAHGGEVVFRQKFYKFYGEK